jgi:hypothetical protein
MAIEFNDRRNNNEEPMGSKRKPGKGPKSKSTSAEKKNTAARNRASDALRKHVIAQHSKFTYGGPGKSKVDKEAMATCTTCDKLKSNIDKLK